MKVKLSLMTTSSIHINFVLSRPILDFLNMALGRMAVTGMPCRSAEASIFPAFRGVADGEAPDDETSHSRYIRIATLKCMQVPGRPYANAPAHLQIAQTTGRMAARATSEESSLFRAAAQEK
jgi:hypothetical protein